MLEWTRRVLATGEAGVDDASLRRRVRLVNLAALIAPAAIVLFGALYLAIDGAAFWPVTLSTVPQALAYLLPIRLNAQGRYELARHVLCLAINAVMFVAAGVFLGPGPGLHVFFLLFAVVPAFVWPLERITRAGGYFLLSLMLYLCVEHLGVARPGMEMSLDAGAYLSASSAVFAVATLGVLVATQTQLVAEHEAELRARALALEEKNDALADALRRVRVLEGIIRVCSYCHRVENDDRGWEQIEHYVREHSHADFSHGICPECLRREYPHYFPE